MTKKAKTIEIPYKDKIYIISAFVYSGSYIVKFVTKLHEEGMPEDMDMADVPLSVQREFERKVFKDE